MKSIATLNGELMAVREEIDHLCESGCGPFSDDPMAFDRHIRLCDRGAAIEQEIAVESFVLASLEAGA